MNKELIVYMDAEAKIGAYLNSWTPTERLVALRMLLPMCDQSELSDYALERAIAGSIDG